MSDEDCQYAFILPIESVKQGYNTIVFTGERSSFRVKRIEVALKYGDVKTHGYF